MGRAHFGNRTVAVKAYTASFEMTIKKREVLIQLKQLKDLQFDNLTAFYGLSLDKKGKLLSVWDMCRKGSLSDIIHNEEMSLDSTFRSSIVR